MRRKEPLPFFEKVEISDAGSEGKAVARIGNKVIFVPFVVPGDVVDIQVNRKKKSYYEGRAVKVHRYSDERVEPECSHFGLCGGCRWQNMKYERQLHYKQKQVADNLQRIGKLDTPPIMPIIPCEQPYYYRNKMEFTFSSRRWFTEKPDPDRQKLHNSNGLGFHLPGIFDRILDIDHCYLQADPSNAIRLEARRFALEHSYDFYDARNWDGYLRNLIIRNTTGSDLMVIVVFRYVDHIKGPALLDHLAATFPAITSLMYVINGKRNDDISDLEVVPYKGNSYISEEMDGLSFRIGPKSFFQTNTRQALKLYRTVKDFAALSGNEIVYDLYTGTGTIACYIAGAALKVVGIEYNEQAIVDAGKNASLNAIGNVSFYAGDMLKVFNSSFVNGHGHPDVIITDPPRAGMHEKVIGQILACRPNRIVYVSCNPATQARDLSILAGEYKISAVQPVDMFPQTHHVENIVLLERPQAK